MKYKLVQIRPSWSNKSWNVSISSDDQDRVKGKTKPKPNPLGFFYYWDTIADDVAFEQLKQCMIHRHSDEINNLQKSILKLKKLKLK